MYKPILIGALVLSTVTARPVLAGPSRVLRAGFEQVAAGYALPVTFDMDQVIRFEGDRISEVWASNVRLFKPRFSKGGNLLVLQAVATPEDLKVLPELGRQYGTLTVEMESGESAVFNLTYTQNATNTILTVQKRRIKTAATDEVLPSILDEAHRRNSPASSYTARAWRVSQDGFVPPLASRAIAAQPSAGGKELPEGNDGFGYWLLELGERDPGAWSAGPDAPAYQAFFEILKRGKATGSSFEPTLTLAQRLSGISEANLIWLVRTLTARLGERQAVAQANQEKTKTPPSKSPDPAVGVSSAPEGETSTPQAGAPR
jgi:hypothetical protein